MSVFYAFHNNGVYEKVSTACIQCLQSENNDTLFHLHGQQRTRRVSGRNLGYFATHPHFAVDFVRVNRQFMVRWEDVAQFSIKNGVVMSDGCTIYPTTRKWMAAMLKRCGLGNAFPPAKQVFTPAERPFPKSALCRPCRCPKFVFQVL